MAMNIKKTELIATGVDSSRKQTITKMLYVSGIFDQSTLFDEYPDIGSSLSGGSSDTSGDNGNSLFKLESIETPELIDEVKGEYIIRYIYTRGGEQSGSWSAGGKNPWQQGFMDFSVSYNEKRVKWEYGYNEDGKLVRNCNSAGCQLLEETTKYLPVISFSYCKKTLPEGADRYEPLINSNTEEINKIVIPAYCGMLLPLSRNLINVYKSNGDLDYKYYKLNAQIIIDYDTWEKTLLDIGTMAYPDEGEKIPGKIFRYIPWKSKEDESDLTITPEFGMIEDVIKARAKYDKIPWEEVTEPLPLEDGKIYKNAIIDKDIPYNLIGRFEYQAGSWNDCEFPTK